LFSSISPSTTGPTPSKPLPWHMDDLHE
jgi:hypothetical protein